MNHISAYNFFVASFCIITLCGVAGGELWPVGTSDEGLQVIRDTFLGDLGKFWVVATWVGTILSITAIGTCLYYPKQRAFPMCYGWWFCAADLLYWGREMIKWSNINSLNNVMVWEPTQPACSFLWIWTLYTDSLLFVMNVSLVVVIYIALVHHIDVTWNADKRYLMYTVIAMIAYPPLYVGFGYFAVMQQGGFEPGPFTCPPKSVAGPIIDITQSSLAVLIEIVFISLCLKRTYAIVKAVKSTAANSGRSLLRLCIRFIVLIFLQTTPRLGSNIYEIYLVVVVSKETQSIDQEKRLLSDVAFVVVYGVICLWINAVFVMASNYEFRQAVLRIPSTISSFTTTASFSGTTKSDEERKLSMHMDDFSAAVSSSVDVSVHRDAEDEL